MGTMTFGAQADEKMSFEMMDTVYDKGVDFFDAAEMYPVPPKAELVGATMNQLDKVPLHLPQVGGWESRTGGKQDTA